MENPEPNSITRLFGELKAGDGDAAAQLWERYFRRMIGLAKRRLGNFPARAEDEEDVAVSAFESLCEGAAAGRFDEFSDRDDLWRLLVTITAHKAVNVKRREGSQKRGGGAVRGESVFAGSDKSRSPAGMDDVARTEPTPEFLLDLEDTLHALSGRLKDDALETVVRARLQGYSNDEIAKQLEISQSSVERKLRLIRESWSRELAK